MPSTSLPGAHRLDHRMLDATAFPSLDQAPVIDQFIQVAPQTGMAPTRRTELRVAHNGRMLYLRIDAWDPAPSTVVARQMRRDVEGMLKEDQVTVVIDPDGDGRNGFLFAVNANGAQFDALVFDGGQMRFDWDARWASQARIGPDGWHADVAIPLSVFGRTRALEHGVNAGRTAGVKAGTNTGVEPGTNATVVPGINTGTTGGATPSTTPSTTPSANPNASIATSNEQGSTHSTAMRAGLPPTWRLNAERWMPNGSELVRLAGIQPDKEVYSLGDALPMPAIAADHEGLGVRVKASLRGTAASSAASGTGRAQRAVEPGLELFHDSPAGLRSTLAVNVDFGDADADERKVNLTRFELFRPEKRAFFLQDAGRFSFGGLVETAVIPYYSRRIGLDASRRPRSLDAGLKLSGSVGGVDVGLFGARVAGGPVAPNQPAQRSADVAVLRVARALDARHRVGMLGTQGNPEGTSGSRVWGVDYQYRSTDFSLFGGAGGKTLEGHAWTQRSLNPDLGAGQAWGASVLYPNLGATGNAEVQHIGAGFRPALGYLAEAAVTRGKGEIGWWHRTGNGTTLIPGVDWNFRRKPGGVERSFLINPEVAYTTPAGDSAMAEIFVETDKVATTFSPVPGVVVDAGNYTWRYLFANLETAPSRPLSAAAEWRAGGYYHGRRDDQSITLTWQPSSTWGARAGLTRNAIRLPSGAFTVRMATFRVDHTPSTRWSESVLLQWDNVSSRLGMSARARWLWTAKREVIASIDRLGYVGADRHAPETQAPADRLRANETRAMVKLLWYLEY
ncbi:hypothetical protein [Pigmentiphaga litoralis]|uniref:carbohydrate binding family 9 domain-containing protein n=1 Tax=Pigmentiphaga litoralis TaxID=516702 RepID=UPI003B435EA4